jgi:serine protease
MKPAACRLKTFRMKRILTSFLLVLACMAAYASGPAPRYSLPPGAGKGDYIHGRVIIRVKATHRADCGQNQVQVPLLEERLKELGVSRISRKFPKAEPVLDSRKGLERMVDLSLVYELHYPPALPLEKVINTLLSTGTLEYAEPHFIQRPLYVPNDPSTGSQYYLNAIRAYQAWDVSKGDTSVVIGITDTGFDLDHPDMEANLRYNYADPPNGVDDDNDGYTDNYRGWDLGENDNDGTVNVFAPPATKPFHGSKVAGCAAAVPDNNTGIAGAAFRCKYLPVKITDTTGYITQGYEGIVYAADHGCKIINCSWGAPDGGSRFGQDVVDYATNNRGALVVAAAGNSNNEAPFYPASYSNVLSVAATTSGDQKWVASSYGIYVDVSAPGENIYSTNFDNNYFTESGTSYSSPLAAACAAVVKSHFPSYSPMQIAQKVRITADHIDTVAGNGAFAEKLGTGRVNMFQALTVNAPAVRMIDRHVHDSNDSVFVTGDTLRIRGTFRNYLAPSGPLTLSLSTTSGMVSILNPLISIGALGTLATGSNASNPFRVAVNPGVQPNTKVIFRLGYSSGAYSDWEYFEVTLNPDYMTIDVNEMAMTVTSKGRLAYNNSLSEGVGVTYKGASLVYEMGLLIGRDTSAVSDAVKGDNFSPDEDFMSLSTVRPIPATTADYELRTKFTDTPAPVPIGISVSHRTFAWRNFPDDKYIVLEYTLKNNSAQSYDSLYAGIFCDWDVQNPLQNIASADTAGKLGYVYSTAARGTYAGIRVLTKTPFRHYAFDNTPGGGGGLDITDGFSSREKYISLSGSRAKAGLPSGSDVCHLVSTGPFSVPPGDSITIAFAVLAADSLQELKEVAAYADAKYNPVVTAAGKGTDRAFSLSAFPNPSSGRVTVSLHTVASGNVTIDLYSPQGERLQRLEEARTPAGYHAYDLDLSSASSGMYFLRVVSGSGTALRKIVLVR